ncbi:MAG TPA: tetratricopeptide repeat protein [Vicinamibacteria bacterium]|nr:tetratricopeptide repeat protein [Vicinamibacteria bacterium]
MDQSKALGTAAEALELAQQGRLDEAEGRYREALAAADPRHHRTPDIHGEYASLLTRMNRETEAGRHYEKHLELELRNDPDEAGAPVVVARYVLGEHYLRLGEAESARRAIAPSLGASDQPLAWLVEAEALYLSGAIEDARAAAKRAVSLAASDAQRERIAARLAELLEDPRSDER